MKKSILFLLTIMILLTLRPVHVDGKTKVAKPTVSVVESDPVMTTLSVKSTTKGAKIYYTTNGTTPTTKSASVKSGAKVEINTSSIAKAKFRAYVSNNYSTTVAAPKVSTTAKPTYKVTVTDKGDIKVTITSVTKGAKIYYNFKSYGNNTTSDEYIMSGETLTINYKKEYKSIRFSAYANKTFSSKVSVDIKKPVQDKYDVLVKEIVLDKTKGLTTPEEKLMALWSWTMENTYYAREANGYTADSTYYLAKHLLFDNKSICNGFALLWEDMANLAGFETKYIVDRKMNHAYCVTKVNDKWFVVDTTHEDKMDSSNSIFYEGFLDNSLYANFSTNFWGFDCSSKRYVIDEYFNTTYFKFLDYIASGEAWLTYDEVTDRYTLHDIYEEEF